MDNKEYSSVRIFLMALVWTLGIVTFYSILSSTPPYSIFASMVK